ncbi:MAG: hypothetical protein KDA98_15375 [Acidimicrobiales bacterium]|nr:hypothetical protein [Acidimicrobiales bacterium]
MTTTTAAPSTRSTARIVLSLLPLGMAAMVAADVVLGDRAEYFNASELLKTWGDLVTGRGLGHRTFLHGQASLGDGASLAAGSALFVIEPAVVLAAIVGTAGAVRRAVSHTRRPRARRTLGAWPTR